MFPVTLKSFEGEQNFHHGLIPQQDLYPKRTKKIKKYAAVASESLTSFGSASGILMMLLHVGM